MKVNEIERLLTRYYDGETSETEEKELKRFFTEEDVPAHLLAEKEIFICIIVEELYLILVLLILLCIYIGEIGRVNWQLEPWDGCCIFSMIIIYLQAISLF